MLEVVRDDQRTPRNACKRSAKPSRSIGLVPTMGALHAGHVALLQAARRENDFVVASIFVNPLQFDRPKDLESYPRMMEEDLKVCERVRCRFCFCTAEADLYPARQLTFVESPTLSEHLCGQFRPGHFRGVATVVLKLFHVVQPDRAYFGEKDAQQLAIIRRMVQDLNVPLTLVPVATVREAGRIGHQFSQQTSYARAARGRARFVSSAAQSGGPYQHGERSVPVLREQALATFAQYPQARVEYFEIVDPEVLAPVEHIDGAVLVAAAMWLGSVRLIDNISWPAADDQPRFG